MHPWRVDRIALIRPTGIDKFRILCRNFASGSPNVDYYAVLGVKPDATSKDIKSAFYELSKRYHPDVAQADKEGAAQKFHEVAQAYEIVGSEEGRKIYDMTRVRRTVRDARSGYARPVQNVRTKEYTDVDIDYKDFEHFQRSTRRRRPTHSHFEFPDEFFQGIGGKKREFKSEWEETSSRLGSMYKDSRAAAREHAEMEAEYERRKAAQEARFKTPTFEQMLNEKRMKENEELRKYWTGFFSVSTLGMLLYFLIR